MGCSLLVDVARWLVHNGSEDVNRYQKALDDAVYLWLPIHCWWAPRCSDSWRLLHQTIIFSPLLKPLLANKDVRITEMTTLETNRRIRTSMEKWEQVLDHQTTQEGAMLCFWYEIHEMIEWSWCFPNADQLAHKRPPKEISVSGSFTMQTPNNKHILTGCSAWRW